MSCNMFDNRIENPLFYAKFKINYNYCLFYWRNLESKSLHISKYLRFYKNIIFAFDEEYF